MEKRRSLGLSPANLVVVVGKVINKEKRVRGKGDISDGEGMKAKDKEG